MCTCRNILAEAVSSSTSAQWLLAWLHTARVAQQRHTRVRALTKPPLRVLNPGMGDLTLLMAAWRVWLRGRERVLGEWCVQFNESLLNS